ncbi:methyltransferase domain-containing protein [Methylomonas sp. UP202]|uniref:class I SAM-dependent methyltransferase n=1 Tax=Methylomonas sp. UP202 TaxID=3040943 RepID=UPI002478D864|nr:methyltransferase domain-containing protein [Methylomonas sp. UP202]WGS88445.1 methyltransferase domain-containing protein [Methylomonas sp. UP202]
MKKIFKIPNLLFRELLKLTDFKSRPNINSLWSATKDIEIMRLNTKNFGYQIARELQPKLQQIDISNEPRNYGLVSKATTQIDIESPWFVYWCNQIKAAPIYHRKLWEFAFLLQILHERSLLGKNIRGIGFGCGQEPLASFFASKGMEVIVSDLSLEQVVGMGWAETGQHTTAKEQAYYPDIVDKETFDSNVGHRYIDMNKIPLLSEKYDFCWSVCAMEHLGTIEKGLAFVENSLSVLKPGGIAIHTTEYNYLSEEKTIDNWPTVLFRKKDFLDLSRRLSRSGHLLLEPDFNVGDRVLDKFIDVPPYTIGEGWLSQEQWNDSKQSAHLKLAIDGFASTCFGLVIIKNSH